MDNNFGQTSAFLDVLKIRSFRFLWFGQIVSQVSINMMAFVLALRVYETTFSNAAVSLMYLAVAIPAVLFGTIAGVYVDRFDKKVVLTLCNVLRAIAVLGFFLSSETYAWIFVLAVMISFITQFFVPAEAPTIPRLVPKTLLLTANSLFTFTFYTSVIAGYILAGPALRFFGPRNIFIVISFLFFLSAIFVRVVPGESSRTLVLLFLRRIFSHGFLKRATVSSRYKRKFSIFTKELLDGYRFILFQKKVRSMVLILVGSQAIISILMTLAPGFADKILGVDIAEVSLLMLAPAAVGMILGVLWIGNFGRRFQGERMIDAGIMGTGLLLLGVALLTHLHSNALLVFLLFSLGLSNAFVDVPANTLLQMNTEESIRGRVYGVLSSLIGGVAFLPVVVAGWLADIFGVTRIMAFISFCILAYGMGRLMTMRNGKMLSRNTL